jgi:ketosteroid isomerase-like protein
MTVDGGTEIDEIEVIDGWTWMRTRINVTMTPPTGEPNQRWRTLTILRKEPDGRWVLARDANLLPT